MKSLFKKYPFKSPKKFIPLAIEHGFTKSDATKFLNKLSHDIKFTRQIDTMLPIYSEHPGGFQFDTLIQTSKAKPRYFLVFININSRVIHTYPMEFKNSESVLNALKQFLNDVPDVHSLTSDQDKAYLSNSITNLLLEHQIDHQTTLKNDHNRLGIINRVIKTLRDINHERDFTLKSMKHAVNAYNNSIHSSIGMKPNSFSETNESSYVNKMKTITDDRKAKYILKPGQRVRIMTEQQFGKKRLNLTPESYIIDSFYHNKYIVKAKDNSVSEYPRYRLFPVTNSKIAKSLNTNRGIISKITNYKNNHYDVVYQGGETDRIPLSYLREGRPTRLSPAEMQYWSKAIKIPHNIALLLKHTTDSMKRSSKPSSGN